MKTAVIYRSGAGNTRAMAEHIIAAPCAAFAGQFAGSRGD